jgi:hypothetical protein
LPLRKPSVRCRRARLDRPRRRRRFGGAGDFEIDACKLRCLEAQSCLRQRLITFVRHGQRVLAAGQIEKPEHAVSIRECSRDLAGAAVQNDLGTRHTAAPLIGHLALDRRTPLPLTGNLRSGVGAACKVRHAACSVQIGARCTTNAPRTRYVAHCTEHLGAPCTQHVALRTERPRRVRQRRRQDERVDHRRHSSMRFATSPVQPVW